MTVFGVNVSDFIPDPHTTAGAWMIVLAVILSVIMAAILLRVVAPVKTIVVPSSAKRAETELVTTQAGRA